MKRLTKPLVVLVAALSIMSYFATPASATTGTITHGTMTVQQTGTPAPTPITTTLGPGGTGSDCGSSATATDSSTGTLTSTTLTGSISVTLTNAFIYLGNTYKFTATGTGTYTSTHSTTSVYHLTIHLVVTGGQIRQTVATDPCGLETTGTLKCPSLTVNSLTLTSSTGTLTQAHPGPRGNMGPQTSTDTTAGSSGTGTVGAFGCVAPFSAMNGASLSITGLGVTFP